MRHFYLIANVEKPNVMASLKDICRFLVDRGATVVVAEKKSASSSYHYTDKASVPLNTECILVLGGDGTLIQAAHDMNGESIPLIGINYGHLGYLADVEADKIYPALERLLNDDYFLEDRMALKGEIIRDGEIIGRDWALNDIVLSRLDTMKMLQFTLCVNNQMLSQYYADGIIVATPTGSTAYSLSAGGPIVMPTSRLFVITPLAPHTIKNSRSIILPEDAVIRLTVGSRPGSRDVRPAAGFDSDNTVMLKEGDTIRIRKAETGVTLVRLDKSGFFDILSKKLN